MRELRKYFVVGDHVKVVAGRHEGETGLVVRIESNLAVLLSDLTYNEVWSLIISCIVTLSVTACIVLSM